MKRTTILLVAAVSLASAGTAASANQPDPRTWGGRNPVVQRGADQPAAIRWGIAKPAPISRWGAGRPAPIR